MADRTARPALVIVELVGTPGAGKTTFQHEIVELMRREGVEVSTIVEGARRHAGRTLPGRVVVRCAPRRLRRPLLWWLFYASALLHAAAFAREQTRLSRYVIVSPRERGIPIARWLHVCFWFMQLCGRERFLAATARNGEVLVLDDGLLHRAVHIFATPCSAPADHDVEAYVDLLRVPRLVVHVVAGRDVCERRVRRRGVWHHSRKLSPTELTRYLASSERITQLAVERARRRGWTIVTVHNREGAFADAQTELRRALQVSGILSAAPPVETVGATS